jgi:hypothetical protein
MTLSPFTSQLASGAYASANTESYDVPTQGRKGIIVIAAVSTPAAGFSQTVTISGVDASSGITWPILVAVAQTDNTHPAVLQVSPGMVAAANTVANSQLPATVRITVTHTDATPINRTIDVQLV